MRRFLAIAWKELIQLRRDRLSMGMMVGIPVMQLLLFGYAINTDVRDIHTVVYDQDQSDESRGFARRMEATGFYEIVGQVSSYDEIGVALRSKEVRVALVVPPGFAEDIEAGRSAQLQLVVDGSEPQIVASATNTAVSLAAARSATLSVEWFARRGLRKVPAAQAIHIEPATWYNPDLRTAVYIVPGLVGVILTMTMVMFTAMAIARERERGTLEQLIVSPVRRIERAQGVCLVGAELRAHLAGRAPGRSHALFGRALPQEARLRSLGVVFQHSVLYGHDMRTVLCGARAWAMPP